MIATVAWPSRSETTLGWMPARSAKRGVTVTQVVQADLRQLGLLDRPHEAAAHRVGRQRLSVLTDKDKPCLGPALGGLALGGLALGVRP